MVLRAGCRGFAVLPRSRRAQLALDVEVVNLAIVEQLLIEGGPVGHTAAIHVISQVVDEPELWTAFRRRGDSRAALL